MGRGLTCYGLVMANERERTCSAHVDGKACGRAARHEVAMGDDFTVPLCPEHLESSRRTAGQWGSQADFDASTRAITRLNPA